MRVVVAVCRNAQGEILLAQRAATAHLGGMWEFPGGKVASGESDEQALTRELHEEIGLSAVLGDMALPLMPLLARQFSYPERTLTIQAYTLWLNATQCAQIHGAEGQVLRWVRPETMTSLPTPAANAPLIAALRWPAYWHFSPDTTDAEHVLAWLVVRCQQLPSVVLPYAAEVDASLSAVARTHALNGLLRHGVVLRLPQLPLADYLALAQQALTLTTAAGLPLLLHGNVRACAELAAFGFHASAQQAIRWQQQGVRKADVLPRDYHLAVAAHTADELATAAALDADWAWLSPVLPTPSHPEAAGLGWTQWAALAAASALPMYALGGLDASMLETARAHGGVGVAGISGF